MRARTVAALVALAVAGWLALRSCGDEQRTETPQGTETPRESATPPEGASVEPDVRDRPDGSPRRRRVRIEPPQTPRPTRRNATVHEVVSPSWLELALPRRTLDVTVVDETGAPRDDIDVHLVSTWLTRRAREALREIDLHSRHLVTTARPGPDGRARLAHVDGGDAALVAGDLDNPLAVLDRGASGWPQDVRLVVPREPGTLVVVLRRADGTPEPGAGLRLERELPWEPSPWTSFIALPQFATSDARGVARLERVGPGRARLFVSPARGPPPDAHVLVDVAADGDTRTEVVLPPVRVLRGVVTSSATGRPLGGAWAEVVRSGAGVRTDAAGRFELPARPGNEGTVRARVSADGHTPAELLWRVDPDGAPVELSLVPLATVRVRCTDEEGAPLAHVTGLVETTLRVRLNLSWVALLHRHVTAAVSDADGLLEIAVPAVDGGRHTVDLYRGGIHVTSVQAPSPASGGAVGDIPVAVPPWPTPR